MTATMELSHARPYAYRFRPESTALVIIDMQRDFLDPNGFGAVQCNNDEIFAQVRNQCVPKTKQVLAACRRAGIQVFHTREGHDPSLSDLPPSKKLRQISSPTKNHHIGIGDQGPMGRLLVRGEYGHDIIDDLRPHPGEVVIDKPGKGSFWDTTFHRALLARGITHLLFAGVTTECCVNTTFREAADRGFECCVLSDCTSGFSADFVNFAMDMLCSYDGLFGFVGKGDEVLEALEHLPANDSAVQAWDGKDLSRSKLQQKYADGSLHPTEVVGTVWEKIHASRGAQGSAVWIQLQPKEALLQAAKVLEERYHGKPKPALYGLPFGVKDSIDVAGIQTTLACEAIAYTPTETAPAITALLDAGALFIGKTNLDQLATGLSGCRSPYGIPTSVWSSNRISGGSSSGSAVATAAGHVTFAVGTDTAGSGRVPAAFNGIVGHKTTKGTYSARGLSPACYSLDTITVLAPDVATTRAVWLVMDEGPDRLDAYAKPQQSLALWHADFRGVKDGGFTFGVPPPDALDVCTSKYRALFDGAIARLERAGGTAKEVPWVPFEGGSSLLYDGSLVFERIASIGADFIQQNLQNLTPATKAVFEGALSRSTKPWEVYSDQHRQAEFTRQARSVFQEVDVLLVPTTPCHPTVAEMQANPVTLNSTLGAFTQFANVLDLCAVALPAAKYDSKDPNEGSLPFGVTLLSAAGRDGRVFDIAREFERTV